MLPPLVTSLGAPPDTGMTYKFSVPFSLAVKKIERPLEENVNSSTEISGDSNKVRFEPVARL